MWLRYRWLSKLTPAGERGVALALMALMIFLVLGMSALVIDYGMIKSSKAEAQRAMDAAALAGASAFLINDPAADIAAIAEDRAKEYAAKHNVHQVPVDPAIVNVLVELDKENVTASYTTPEIGLWFARIIGVNTMAISATATAHAQEAGISTCLMPIALPDKYVNGPDATEDVNGNGILDYNDRNNNGQWDWSKGTGKDAVPNEEWEQWQFEPGTDTYYPPNSTSPTGYTTADYGLQMVVMMLDPGSTGVASNYLAWGKDGEAASDSAMVERIKNPSCDETQLGEDFVVRAANGTKPNLGGAWADRINREPSANWTWDESQNTVSCPGGCPANWESVSPRVVTVGLYDPSTLLEPSNNTIQFLNFAKIFLDQRPCDGPPGGCKAEVTARFLGFVEGVGGPGNEVGPLVKRLVLIK
jgi:Flp pilus assembly protein TadG